MLDDNELLFDELYEKTKDCGRVQFINLLMEKERENQELKKQLDELQTLYNNMFKCHCNRVQVETLLSQQKEFIEYLESEMILFQEYMKEIECSDRCHGDYPITYWSSKYKLNEVAEILSKYKEIIGVRNE